jgi:Phosphodiester glycosidase/FlgD Ig-like domain
MKVQQAPASCKRREHLLTCFGVVKRGLLLAALAALTLPAVGSAWSKTTVLVPGVTYTKTVRWAFDGPLVTHVITAPPPGGLYGLRPIRGRGAVRGRETITSMERRLTMHGTAAGINGDFSSFSTGRPSGIFLSTGVLSDGPNPFRSALGIAFDGSLRVRRLGYFGSWQVDGFTRHPMEAFNRPLSDPPGVALFTTAYRGPTPRRRRAVDIVLSGVPPIVVNGSQRTRVAARRWGGGSWVPPGGAVLQASGFWRRVLVREARLGRSLTLRVLVRGLWTDVADALGGGPVLVRAGQPILRAREGFTRSQLFPRHPRTAVGQLQDGRVILVVVDGRSTASLGLRNWQLALEMARLGAVRAMGLDGGGSSVMAFDGRVLNRPSDGAQRAIANGLFVFYYGAYAPRPPHPVVSPNGDGVLDVQHLTAKFVRRSQVDVRLVRPNGTVGWRYSGTVTRRLITHDLTGARQSGTWRWIAKSVDTRGRRSTMVRRFLVNNTLGHLRFSRYRMRVVPVRGGGLGIAVELTRRSDVTVAVRRVSDGLLVRRLQLSADEAPGTLRFRWDGKNENGYVVRGGLYRIRVKATNSLGTISLERRLRVVRVSAP